MTAFTKTDFQSFNGWVYYGKDSKFIARFKHKGMISKSEFLTQLIKNHTVEDYFSKLDSGIPPLKILIDADVDWYEKKKEKFLNKHK